MIKILWELLVENLRELKPKTRVNIIIWLIIVFTLWFALVKSRYEIKNELRSGKDDMIIELRHTILTGNSRVIRLEIEKDSLTNVNYQLEIKIITDSVKSNIHLIGVNQSFIDKQNKLKKDLK